MYKIHFAGSFSREQVATEWVGSTLAIAEETARSIETEWTAAISNSGKMLFDGALCRVESWNVDQGRLNLSFSHTSYKWFWGTNFSGKTFPATEMANALGLSAALESSDGFLLFGRRNSRMAYHRNRVHPFAGSAVDIDVFAEMRRELFEELAIGDAEILEMTCIGMAEDLKIRQPELVFYVKAGLSRAEIEGRLDRAEHDGVWVERDRGELTPIAQATRELWKGMRVR